MRLLISGMNFHPEKTGVGYYTGDMARWLADRGHSVDVITAPPHYPEWQVHDDYVGLWFVDERWEGMRVMRAPVFLRRNATVRATTRYLLEASFLASALRWWFPAALGPRYDAVLSIVPPSLANAWALAYAFTFRVPLWVHVQDFQLDAAVQLGMLPSSVGTALLALERRALAIAAGASTISHGMLSRLVDKGVDPRRAHLVPNWADVRPVPEPASDPALRMLLGASPSDVLALYAGSLGEKQGLDTLIAAASMLADEPRIRFAVVGDGSARRRIEQTVRDRNLPNMVFHDLFPRPALASLLASADLHLVVQRRVAADLVMPSKMTNILASGRPYLATADDGTELAEVTRRSQGGVIVPPERPELLADALRRMASSETYRRTLGTAGQNYALEHLARESVLETFEAKVRAVVAGDGAR